jgi:hypothetical protein
MGLSITDYPMFDESVKIKAYANIRDIRMDKTQGGNYTLTGCVKIYTNSIYITAILIELNSDNIFTNTWKSLYTELKRLMTEKKLAYTDV